MILRKVIPILVVSSCLSHSAPAQKAFPDPSTIPPSFTVGHAQDFSKVIVPITSLKITPSAKLGMTGKLGPKLDVGADFGSGLCLDAACHFTVTNYHVAMRARAHRIKREKIIKRYFATGPNDEGATANNLGNGDVLPYVKERDLAMFELRHSLHHHHGLAYSLDEPQVGQEVDIYGFPHGFPKGTINPPRRLTRFPATFKAPTTSGLLAFDYQFPANDANRIKGASGGIVVDRKTEKVLGILCETNETTAVAVSTGVAASSRIIGYSTVE